MDEPFGLSSNFRIASSRTGAADVCVCGVFVCGWFCFGWVLGFSRPVSLCFVETVFVESLILAQDERWRRA